MGRALAQGAADVQVDPRRLFERRVREQIAGELVDSEFVVWQVAIERVDHPIAIAPHVEPQRIGPVTGRISITG